MTLDAQAVTMIRKVVSITMSLLFLLALSVGSAGAQKDKEEITATILRIMSSDDITRDSRDGGGGEFTYSFDDACHFRVHGEWKGEIEWTIDDSMVPLDKVEIEPEIEDGRYFLFFRCVGGKNCISIKGQVSGDTYDYMFLQSIVPAGGSSEVFKELRKHFEDLMLECRGWLRI